MSQRSRGSLRTCAGTTTKSGTLKTQTEPRTNRAAQISNTHLLLLLIHAVRHALVAVALAFGVVKQRNAPNTPNGPAPLTSNAHVRRRTPLQAPIVVLRNADKGHVGKILAESSILYQVPAVTAALLSLLSIALLVAIPHTSFTHYTEREDRHHGGINTARAREAHLLRG
jgi:hypothetical protein